MTTHPHAHKANRQTLYVVIALVLGIVIGELLNLRFGSSGEIKPNPMLSQVIAVFTVLTDIFLRLVKMIIAPLVISTLVVGMAKMGDINTVGRIGVKALLWFFSASIFSLLLGMLLVNILEPGSSLHIALPDVGAETGLPDVKPTLNTFAAHIFPKSVVEAMANNEILQIVVFSMFFGVACASLGELAQPMVKLLDSLTHIMLKVTSYVMHYAPVAVFSAIAAVIAQHGIGVLLTYGKFIGEFYFGLLLLCSLLGCFAFLFLGHRIFSLISHIREPMLLAFGTASSESAYPKLLQQLERFGCDEKVCGLVLPLADQLLMLLVLLFTSKGVARVPRASLIVISATLSMFKIPEAGLLLLLGIDQVLDMGRSATNVFGNSIASVLISRWEKALR